MRSERPPLRLALAGFGTVGMGLADILEQNREKLTARAGREIRIHSVLVRDQAKARTRPLPSGARLCADVSELVQDARVDVVVELMGGLEMPRRLIRAALEAGKHVVTANKALLAEEGEEIFRLAGQHGLHLGYEASVCGGVPVIQVLREGLAANKILALAGILNGTCNYILSSMSGEGLSFEAALKRAQSLGLAEADPSLDIEGWDSAHKLALLIRLAWGINYPFKHMPVTGITRVTPEDIRFAGEFGCNIKLLGQAALTEDRQSGRTRLDAWVFPSLVPESNPLSQVGQAYNALRVEGNAVGAVFLHGLGAGGPPTGSAVAADLLRIALGTGPHNTGYAGSGRADLEIMPPLESASGYYFRLTVPDRAGVLKVVAAAMAEQQISVAQVIQKSQRGGGVVPLVIMTHQTTARAVEAALAGLKSSGILTEAPVYYKVLAAGGE
ncbi:MAG: homoserine dehydrogenase [Deltaproteobacteria bacterium]|jgi:homoserine dehydrogenase|nr:homoserine dehydrogenase [Deltaproteobacteria bacterium]